MVGRGWKFAAAALLLALWGGGWAASYAWGLQVRTGLRLGASVSRGTATVLCYGRGPWAQEWALEVLPASAYTRYGGHDQIQWLAPNAQWVRQWGGGFALGQAELEAPADPPPPSVTIWFVTMPFWFLTIVMAALVGWAWRRKKVPEPAGFPVEVRK